MAYSVVGPISVFPHPGAHLHSYLSGTTTPTPTYPTAADADAGTNANNNPLVLKGNGELPDAMFLPSGITADFKLTSSDESTTYWGPTEFLACPSWFDYMFDTLSDLSSVTPSTASATAWLKAFSTPGDLGEGQFIWDSSDTTTADGYIVIDPSGGTSDGRWTRCYHQLIPEYFGAVGDGATDDSAAFNAAFTYAFSLVQGGGKGGVYGVPPLDLVGNKNYGIADTITAYEGCRLNLNGAAITATTNMGAMITTPQTGTPSYNQGFYIEGPGYISTADMAGTARATIGLLKNDESGTSTFNVRIIGPCRRPFADGSFTVASVSTNTVTLQEDTSGLPQYCPVAFWDPTNEVYVGFVNGILSNDTSSKTVTLFGNFVETISAGFEMHTLGVCAYLAGEASKHLFLGANNGDVGIAVFPRQPLNDGDECYFLSPFATGCNWGFVGNQKSRSKIEYSGFQDCKYGNILISNATQVTIVENYNEPLISGTVNGVDNQSFQGLNSENYALANIRGNQITYSSREVTYGTWVRMLKIRGQHCEVYQTGDGASVQENPNHSGDYSVCMIDTDNNNYSGGTFRIRGFPNLGPDLVSGNPPAPVIINTYDAAEYGDVRVGGTAFGESQRQGCEFWRDNFFIKAYASDGSLIGHITSTEFTWTKGQITNGFAAWNHAVPTSQPSITGALSSVTDANTKAVLTSIINALSGCGLATNGTT